MAKISESESKRVESELDKLFENWDMHDLANFTKDVMIDNPDYEDVSVNSMDKFDMMDIINEWVTNGIEDGDWTLDSWVKEISDDHEAEATADSEAVDTPIDDALNDWRNATHKVQDSLSALKKSHPEVYEEVKLIFDQVRELDNLVAKLL